MRASCRRDSAPMHVLPIEVLPFGWRSQARFLESLGARCVIRQTADGKEYHTDQGNLILDCDFGPIADRHKTCPGARRPRGNRGARSLPGLDCTGYCRQREWRREITPCENLLLRLTFRRYSSSAQGLPNPKAATLSLTNDATDTPPPSKPNPQPTQKSSPRRSRAQRQSHGVAGALT